MLTTKSGEFVVFLRNCVASMCKLIHLNVKNKKKNKKKINKRIVPNKARIAGVYLGGIPLSRAPQIFRRNTRFALTGIRPDYQFLLLIFAAIWGSDFRDNLIH